MGRPKKEQCYERIQIYLIPELASRLRCYARESQMRVSMFIRIMLEGLYNNKQKGYNDHEQH